MGPYGPVCGAAWGACTMPSSSTTSTFLSTAPSDDGAAMSAESGVVAGQSRVLGGITWPIRANASPPYMYLWIPGVLGLICSLYLDLLR